MIKRKKHLERIRRDANNVSLDDLPTPKKDLEYYMTLPYTIELTPDVDGYWFAEISLLDGCMTNGKSQTDALAMIEDAKRAWLTTALEMGLPISEPEVESA